MGGYVALVLVPALKLPQSRVYSSLLGYPSLQRYLGKPIEVEVNDVKVRSMTKTVVAEGAMDYLNVMPVESEVLGVVTAIFSDIGQKVKKGDVLLKIQPGVFRTRELELARDQAQADLDEAKVNLEREKMLFKHTAIGMHDLELAELAVKHCQGALAIAEEVYKQTMSRGAARSSKGDR